MEPTMSRNGANMNNKIWIGVAVGAAIGLSFALTRRKRTRWDNAREITKKVANRKEDFVEKGKDIADRVRIIYDEACKVVEDASELWTHGRRLVGY